MNIIDATKSYETWLDGQTQLLAADISLKHQAMRDDLFCFLRATFYRWIQVWPDVCPELAHDATVLAVGDLHVENFGTWRDTDARLVWGINDFDECYPLPFTQDLVRLATSAYIATMAGELDLLPKTASAWILRGYQDCLKTDGQPLVLVDKSTPLRTMARDRLNNPERFWKKLRSYPPVRKPIPARVLHAIHESLPDHPIELKFLHRIAGMGSLGKERFTGVGAWLGGEIAREAKALSPSACHWAAGKKDGCRMYYEDILKRAVRCPDPFFKVRGQWLIRRLSPDCFRIRLANLPEKRNEQELLYSMGWETANIHLGSLTPMILAKQISRKPKGWLHKAAKAMRSQITSDWKVWRKS